MTDLLENVAELKTLIEKRKAFPKHRGRPGKVGGSLPKGQGNIVRRPNPPTELKGTSSFSDVAAQGRISSSKPLSGGISYATLVQYEGDGKGVWKKDWDMNDARMEAGAYALDKLLGLGVVPETVRAKFKGKDGSSQLFIEDATLGLNLVGGATFFSSQLPDEKVADITDDSRECVILLDLIIGNKDRNHKNWLLKDGHIYAVDNGLSDPGGYPTGEQGQMLGNNRLLTTSEMEKREVNIPAKRMETLKNLTKESLVAAMDKAGMYAFRSNYMWDNIQAIIKTGGKITW